MYMGEICEYKTAVMKEVTDHNYSLLKAQQTPGYGYMFVHIHRGVRGGVCVMMSHCGKDQVAARAY